MTKPLALHETLELHELLNFKSVCLTKGQTMQGMLSDEGLKALMAKDVEQSSRVITELQELLADAQP